MPSLYPTRYLTTRIGLPYAMWFVKKNQQDNQGVVVKNNDGSFSWQRHRPETGVFYEIGRGPYYLTLAEAREALGPSELYNVMYTDDYNDEYQDYYICNLATNTPDEPATDPEAIA